MILRRLPMLVVSVVVVVAVAITTRTTVEPVQAVFSNVGTPWMPAAPLPGGLNSTWFCPGVPAAGEAGTGGVVTAFNTGDAEMRGRLTILRVDGEPITQAINVPPYGAQPFDIDELVDSPYAAAFVEIDGGGGLVEQKAIHPQGESVSACANSSAAQWYLATGDTLDDSVELLVLSNPHDNDAIVDIALSTSRGPREPTELQNFPVPAQSVRIVDVGAEVIANEEEIGVRVVATRGNVVVGRSQTYGTERRTGYVMSLAAPALSDQWWFAYGVQETDVTVSYSLYNPNEFDVEVTPFFGGYPRDDDDFVIPEPVVVPNGEVTVFDLADVEGLPGGLVSAVFSTAVPDQRIVAERTVTRTIDGIRTTSVTPGAPPRPADGYVANTWYLGVGAAEPTEGGLVIYNVDPTDAVVTLQTITPNGIETVGALAEVDLLASQTISIDLTDELVGQPLIIRSTSRIFVERVLRREPEAQGRVSVWAVPASA